MTGKVWGEDVNACFKVWENLPQWCDTSVHVSRTKWLFRLGVEIKVSLCAQSVNCQGIVDFKLENLSAYFGVLQYGKNTFSGLW